MNTSSIKKLLKTEAALIYLALLKSAKKVFLYFIGVLSVLAIIFIGFSFLIVRIAVYSENHILLTLGVAVALILIPGITLFVLLSQKNWLRIFGVDQIVKDLEAEEHSE